MKSFLLIILSASIAAALFGMVALGIPHTPSPTPSSTAKTGDREITGAEKSSRSERPLSEYDISPLIVFDATDTADRFRMNPLRDTPRDGSQSTPPPFSPSSPGNVPISIPEISRVENFFSNTFSPAPSSLLTLPQVRDEELTIDASGVRTFSEYLAYFAERSTAIPFSPSDAELLLRSDAQGTRLPLGIVAEAIDKNEFGAIRPSLLALRNLARATEQFRKSIPVYGEAVEVNRTLIAFDRATLQMIDHAVAVADGAESLTTFADFFSRYEAAAQFYNEAFLRKDFSLAGKTHRAAQGIFSRLARALGIAPARAIAQGPPFGGMITFVEICVCDPGLMFVIGPPGPPGMYFLSLFMLASPLFFPFKQVHPGAIYLGNYGELRFCILPNPLTGCPGPIIGAGLNIWIAGTSQ